MSRPATGVDTSRLPRKINFKPMSDQTYYKYRKRILEAYQEIERGEADNDAEHVQEWTEALNALTHRIEQAGLEVPTRAQLEKPQRKKREPLPPATTEAEERRQQTRRQVVGGWDHVLQLMKGEEEVPAEVKTALKEKLDELNTKLGGKDETV